MKFVSQMNEPELLTLNELKKNGPTNRLRERAHILLLSHDSFSINELTRIFNHTREIISDTIDRWEFFGIAGLYDKPRSGRPSANIKKYSKIIQSEIQKGPKSIKEIFIKIQEKLNINFSMATLKRICKKLGYSWRRIKKSLRKKRDDTLFKKSYQEIENLLALAKAKEIDLFYFDQSFFSLRPEVPYGWQPLKENIEILPTKSKSINVLGLLSPDNKFHSYVFECNINSEIVVSCLDKFCETIEKETILIIDNAPIHRSKMVQARIPEWKKKGLILKFIPPYSPELNKIEILWRFIKYKWMPYNAYKNLNSLKRNLLNILRNVGDKYVINFA